MSPSTGFRRGWMNLRSLSLCEKAAAGGGLASHLQGTARPAPAIVPAFRRVRRDRRVVSIGGPPMVVLERASCPAAPRDPGDCLLSWVTERSQVPQGSPPRGGVNWSWLSVGPSGCNGPTLSQL